jgi:lincosamide nucleotidyltransferase A/C/D/E
MARYRFVRALRAIHRNIASSAAAPLLHPRVIEPVRRRFIRMRLRDVLEVVDALDAAGVRVWLAGGWGVDALLGRQTRAHSDLDLAFEAEAEGVAQSRALEQLGRLGYRHIEHEDSAGKWLPVRICMRDPAGRTVDLLPVTINRSATGLSTGLRPDTGYPIDAFTVGSLDGRRVGCLSPGLQMAFHEGYEPRRIDRHDIALLGERFGLAAPPPYG